MKIGIFSELYSPSIGGMEVRHGEIAKTLIRQGHQVSIYCIGHCSGLLPYEKIDGVDVFRHPIVKNYKQPFIKPLKRAITPLIRYAFWCSQVLSKEDFDLIIYNQWPLLHVALAPVKIRSRSIIDWCEVRHGKFYQFCQKSLPKLSGFNMAVSPAVCEQIGAASGCPVFFLPSGISHGKYISLDRTERSSILYLGRIAEHKNIGLLIQSFELLRDCNYQGRLIIAGDGPEFEKIRSQVVASSHRDFIDLLGLVSEEEKVQLLSKAELLVITSKREGFPQIVAEAMASGLPIVTTEYPENGTAAVVSYYGCGLVSKASPDCLSQSILQALSNWQALSDISLQKASDLDWSLLVETLLGKLSLNSSSSSSAEGKLRAKE
jgi:glycosyltransferase involved in cell wall biosynthesis